MFQSFTTPKRFPGSLRLQLFDCTKCLLMPIGVPNVICLCDNDKRGCNVMVVSRGSTEPVKPGFRNESTGKPLRRVEISTNEAFTSLTMPVAMSTMIDEASVTGWLSASSLIISELTCSTCIKGSTHFVVFRKF